MKEQENQPSQTYFEILEKLNLKKKREPEFLDILYFREIPNLIERDDVDIEIIYKLIEYVIQNTNDNKNFLGFYTGVIPTLIEQEKFLLDKIFEPIMTTIDKGVDPYYLFVDNSPNILDLINFINTKKYANLKDKDNDLRRIYLLIEKAITTMKKKEYPIGLYDDAIPALIKTSDVDLNKIYPLIDKAIDKGVALYALYNDTIPALIEKEGFDLKRIYGWIDRAIENQNVDHSNLYGSTIPALIKRPDVELKEIYELIKKAINQKVALGLSTLCSSTIPALIQKSDADPKTIYDLTRSAIEKITDPSDFFAFYTYIIRGALEEREMFNFDQISELIYITIDKGVDPHHLFFGKSPVILRLIDFINTKEYKNVEDRDNDLSRIYTLIDRAITSKTVKPAILYGSTIPALIGIQDADLQKIYGWIDGAITSKTVDPAILYGSTIPALIKKDGVDPAVAARLYNTYQEWIKTATENNGVDLSKGEQ